ncbi:MAG: ATP-binding domain-containing protein, partial [Oscillospiraceae bacterium]|nr:ATP-binding domain-containing protein [Oscillospiraceae bacterium]
RANLIPTVRLLDVFRQAEKSAIIRSAHAVNRGAPPELGNAKGSDSFFLPRRESYRLVDTVVELCKTRLPENMGIPSDAIQVISPTRRGDAGTVALNRALQAALNPAAPDKRERYFGDMLFREGDRVMQTKNNYDIIWEKEDGSLGTGVFNGDVGRILRIEKGTDTVFVLFDDKLAQYELEMLAELDMAYAMTVHKAQGSEYRAVVFAATPCAPGLMVRGVLYTAITRAKELLVLVGDDSVLYKMAENDRRQKRYSGLRWRLKNGGSDAVETASP